MGREPYHYALHVANVLPQAERNAITSDLHQALAIGYHLVDQHRADARHRARLFDLVGALLALTGLPTPAEGTAPVQGTTHEACALASGALRRLAFVADRKTARMVKYGLEQIRYTLGWIDPAFGRVLGLLGWTPADRAEWGTIAQDTHDAAAGGLPR